MSGGNNTFQEKWHARTCHAPPQGIKQYMFDVKDNEYHLNYSIILLEDFFKADGQDHHNINDGADMSMLKMCGESLCAEKCTLEDIMSKKVMTGLFPFNVKAGVRSIGLLTD